MSAKNEEGIALLEKELYQFSLPYPPDREIQVRLASKAALPATRKDEQDTAGQTDNGTYKAFIVQTGFYGAEYGREVLLTNYPNVSLTVSYVGQKEQTTSQSFADRFIEKVWSYVVFMVLGVPEKGSATLPHSDELP